jgi:alpha-L-arabinofuranosidase
VRSAQLTLDPAFAIAELDRRLFGSFVEHMGRAVYSGIFEPGHPTAGAAGFRGDVLALVRELGVTLVRYPGGNFVSSYRWEDGVGPVEDRPRRLDLAWRSVEPNTVGLNEFAGWAAAAGAEPMLAVNLGTRGIAEACELLEYANYPEGTRLSDLRVAHGYGKPHDIRLWCLGNEADGPWQIGHRTAAEYGRLAAETARAMRRQDPRVELVACGSSNSGMPSFGTWERTVLEHTYELVDYLSLHAYYQEHAGPDGAPDTDSFLASAVDMDRFIDAIVATCDHVGATLRQPKQIKLAFDEWNVWNQSRFAGQDNLPWSEAPELIEDVYTLTDAVVVGGLLISLLRHADRVAIACQAQLVNVIAPIMTRRGGPTWRQTIFHPFAQAARYARGTVLRVEPAAPLHDTTRYGPVPVLDATATHDPETGAVTLLAVNRDRHEPIELHADVRALPGSELVEHLVLADRDPHARNTADQPDRVVPRPLAGGRLDGGRLVAVLPPLSWNVLRLARSADRPGTDTRRKGASE